MRNAVKVALSFILVVLTLEGVLRFTGTQLFPDVDLEMSKDDENKIRILAIGESTTDPRVVKGKAWPQQLEQSLTDEGYPVRVYNLGKAGTNTALILSAMPEYLHQFRPHIVVSMIGINDFGVMKFDYAHTSSRLLRFLYLLRERISSRLSCRLNKNNTSEVFVGDSWNKWRDLGAENLSLIEKEMRGYWNSSSDIASALVMTSNAIRQNRSDYKREDIEPLMKRAFELDPLNEMNAKMYLPLLVTLKDKKCFDVAAAILPCAPNLDDSTLSHLAICHRMSGANIEFATLKNRGISVIKGTESELSENYRSFFRMVSQNGSKLVAVQYPTLPLESLKSHFKNSGDNVVFVSNEENFKKALETSKFEDLFADNFRGSWGHPTEKGHGLIAQEVLKSIRPMLKSL